MVLPLPDFGDGTKSGQGSLAVGHQRASSKNGAAAAKFLDYLMSDGPVTAMTDANAAPPGTTSVTATLQALQPGRPARSCSPSS